MELRP